MTEVVIASACRTPIGAFNGGFATVHAHTLGAAVIRDAMTRAKVEGAAIKMPPASTSPIQVPSVRSMPRCTVRRQSKP